MAQSGTSVNTPVMQGTASYVLGRQPAATNITPMGDVSVSMSGDMVMTTAKLSGLTPNTYYVAHYHTMGTASTTDPCASNGMALLSSKIVGMSDKDGMVTLSGSVLKSEILQAAYFNVHTAKDDMGTPADAGIACTAIKMM
ncbi:superoxide dismutase [Deinococcus irradiatisoli]|uniref:Superoxide dismutase n=2 Tax=Deinococcus irradiatisoli TaxID=2202254 RepID=A0A2Z3JKU0_9DEIO|nr:superoxide dismutase [Deinococcus irradiatisoli]